MADFYADRSGIIPPLPWKTFAPTFSHAIEFNKDSCRWTILGDAGDVQRSTQRQAILLTLETGDMKIGELTIATGMKRNNLDGLLHSMVTDGEVYRAERGVYSLNPTPR